MAERGQLPKAYLRLDPNADAHADLHALVTMMLEANRQPERGRFKALDRLRLLLGRKRLQACLDRADLVALEDGRWLLAGWDEWQEGDLRVGDRMRLIRGEKNQGPTPGATRTANWRLRNHIFERDHYTCRYCGNADTERKWLIAEHVVPAPDGPTTEENLVTACRPCNKRKGGRTPEQAGMVLLPVPVTVVPVTRHGDAVVMRPASEASGVKASETDTATDPARRAPALTASADPPWNRDAADLWAAVFGGGAPSPLFAALKPGVKTYTWERIKPVLRWYLDQTPLEYVNVAKFISGFPSMETRMKAGTTTALARAGQRGAAPSVGERTLAESQKFVDIARRGGKG